MKGILPIFSEMVKRVLQQKIKASIKQKKEILLFIGKFLAHKNS